MSVSIAIVADLLPFPSLLFAQAAEVTLWHWIAFGALVLALLTIDLVVFHRQAEEPTIRQAALWTLVWLAIAAAFNVFVWIWRGPQIGVQFLLGYLLEWSLSMDNVFVFAVLFKYFATPLKYQYRVLFWGILGAILMRLTFILAGVAVLERADWIMPLFGAVLVWQGIRLAAQGDHEPDPEQTLIMRLARWLLPISQQDHGDRFFVVEGGRRVITPLFLVLLVIEWTDVIFAVDSVPAIFGVTLDPFTIFTSNIFAILGLRALYFLLAGATEMFRFLKYGLAGVLIFIGAKMIVEFWRGPVVNQFVSLAVVAGLLVATVVASLVWPHHKNEPPV